MLPLQKMTSRKNKSAPQHRQLLRILGITLFMLAVVRTSNSFSGMTGQLSDIAKNSYEGQAALHLQKKGVITGFPDGTFRGQNPVNRAEAVKMLLLAGNYTLRQIQNTGNFPDIQPGAWYEQFALNGVEKNIMAGYPDGTFGPSKSVLRAEFIKMLSNAFLVETSLPYHYTDVPIDAWYSEFAGTADKYNLFLYDKEQLLPSAPMSREEVAWAIYQMLIFKNYGFVVRTPFDYTFTSQPKVPSSLHAAANSSSAIASSSVSSVTPAVQIQSSSSSSSVSRAAKPQYCIDSDISTNYPNGYNPNKKGIAMNLLMASEENTFVDTCRANTNVLLEFYCNENGYLAAEQINCSISCIDGACSANPIITSDNDEVDPRRPTGTLSSASSVASSASSVLRCTDTDATHRFTTGENGYAKGTTNGYDTEKKAISETDTCINPATVKEFYCSTAGNVLNRTIYCKNGCENGACVSPGETGACSDTDASTMYPSGKDFTQKARIFVQHPEEGNFTDEDYCESPTQLNEFYCGTNGRVGRYIQTCNCEDGVCVSPIE